MARMRRMRTREARIRVEFCAEATEETRWCAAVPGAAASCHITLSFLCGGREPGGTATVRPCIAATSSRDKYFCFTNLLTVLMRETWFCSVETSIGCHALPL